MTLPVRPGERGFSLVETLIGVAVAALVAALVLPMATRAVRDNFRLADRGLDQADRAAAEAQFRRLLQSAGPLRGDGATLELTADLDEPVACAPAGPGVDVRLQVVADRAGAVLVCRAGTRRSELARWPTARAAFAYDAGDGTWRDVWARAGAASGPPLVRMAVEEKGRVRGLWIERAGAPDPDLAAGGAR